MRFVTDRCLNCGTPQRPTRAVKSPPHSIYLRPDGSIDGTPFWFCSASCYEQAREKFIEHQYRPSADPYNDPDILYLAEIIDGQRARGEITDREGVRELRQFINGFETRKELDVGFADNRMHKRIRSEANRIEEEEKEKLAEQAAKEEERELDRREREAEREANRLRIKAEREQDRSRIEQERDEKREQLQREKEEAAEQDRVLQQEAFDALIADRDIPQRLRFEHTHILGPSGSGKTTLLSNIFLHDVFDDATREFKDPPAYIIIDPKGDLFERLCHIKVFAAGSILGNRLVIVDPLDHPALNVFNAKGRNPAQIISNFSYIFSTTRQRLTGKQDTCFGFCVALLFKLPGSTLFTLLDLLEDRTQKGKPPDPRFEGAISHLITHSEMAMRRFFETDFYSPNYASTRDEIKTRIWEVLKDEHLFAMLNAPDRKLDIAECIRQRKIVVVNTRMDVLKLGHQTLGRYILALAIDAIQSRANEPRNTWTPTFIVIDEFQEFVDEFKTPEMLRLIRSYNAGAVLAHHNMYPSEFNDAIRSAISTNTSIKFASKPAGMDVGYMARDLQCEPEFLTQRAVKSDTHARFACYFTGLSHPFIKEVELDEINQWPKMDDSDYAAMRARNKQALYSPPSMQPPPQAPPPQAPAPPSSPRTSFTPRVVADNQPKKPGKKLW